MENIATRTGFPGTAAAPARTAVTPRDWAGVLDTTVTALFLAYTFVPMLAVLLFSLAGKWTTTILPERWTIQAYIDIFANPEFPPALGRSFLVSGCVVVIDITVVTMALLGASLTRGRRVIGVMESLSIIPVALPGVVLALGGILFYGEAAPFMLGQPILLILMEAAFALPLAFWILQNAFRTVDVRALYDAARTLGAGAPRFMLGVLLPCVGKGALAAGLMTFTTAFNNFALAQLLVGAGWKTMPLLQYTIMRNDGHQTSAMAIIGIGITFVMAVVACSLNRGKSKQ